MCVLPYTTGIHLDFIVFGSSWTVTMHIFLSQARSVDTAFIPTFAYFTHIYTRTLLVFA